MTSTRPEPDPQHAHAPAPEPQSQPPKPDKARRPCELCEAARLTTWYHEDDLCWVAECEICGVPMVVWRDHAIDPSEEKLELMLGHLGRVADEVLGEGKWSFDRHMRQIPDHFHAHARDPNWWMRRFGGGNFRPMPRT